MFVGKMKSLTSKTFFTGGCSPLCALLLQDLSRPSTTSSSWTLFSPRRTGEKTWKRKRQRLIFVSLQVQILWQGVGGRWQS